VADINRVQVTGRLTRDVELRYIPSGAAVAEIGVAINERVKRHDQWVDETTFADVTVWGKQAEMMSERLSKGSAVTIEGRLRLDTWEKDGQKRSKLKVVADNVVPHDAKKDEAPAGEDEWA
jgi:single-strand DNA-binding protein